MLVGVTFFLLALTSDPTPTPTPQQEQQNPFPDIPTTVHVVRSKAVELRATSPDRVRCGTLPLELVHDPEPPIPRKLPAASRIAGSRHTLGVLLPKDEKGFPLSLFRSGRVIGEYRLKLPETENIGFLTVPLLYLGEEGTLVALRGPKGFAVFVSGTLTTVEVDEETADAQVTFRPWEVMWCPIPQWRSPWRRGMAVSQLFKEGEEPPLWLRADLDGSNRQVLARVDVNRVNPEYPKLLDWAMGIATRRDGKLWLVGLGSTEVWLATAGGRILRREVLPVRLRTQADDEKEVEKSAWQLLRESPAFTSPVLTDATRRPKRGEFFTTGIVRALSGVYARDNDLVVTTWSYTQPANAVILVPADGSEARCWAFPPSLGEPYFAVTDEELWFLTKKQEEGDENLRYILWEDLLAFEKEAEKTKGQENQPRK